MTYKYGTSINSPHSLTNLLHPSVDGGWRDIYRAGWVPDNFNQQWGGSQWGGLPDGSFGDVATGSIAEDAGSPIGMSSLFVYMSQGFKVPESGTYSTVFIKLYKFGNPTDQVNVNIWSDNGSGSPSTLLGGGGVILSSTIVGNDFHGDWYRVTFATPQTLTAGTQYHLVCSKGGNVNGSHYYCWARTNYIKYPHGLYNSGTTTPAWTQNPAIAHCFLIPNIAAQQHLQTSGVFDGKIVFNESATYTQSKALRQPMRNFFDGKSFTFLQRYTNLTIGKPIAEFAYGFDHDRLAVDVYATGGVVRVVLYETDGSAWSVLGTTNVSGASFVDIAVAGRFMGDGLDYLKLYVNGKLEGSLTGQTFTMDAKWRELGTARIGGAMPHILAWTVDTPMTALPSAAGWTWNGTATEASCMAVSGGKLYQNSDGYSSGQTGYYTRATTLNNATGWAVCTKMKVSSQTLDTLATSDIQISDGTKTIIVTMYDYYIKINRSLAQQFNIQHPSYQENVVLITGKGSDVYVYVNGELVYDGTGKLTLATTANSVVFGNTTSPTTIYGDAVWDYVKIYNGGMVVPQYNSASSLHEAAYWSGDKTELLPHAYNASYPVSIKELCGVERNYVGDGVEFTENRRGIIPSSTSNSSFAQIADIEAFVFGSEFEADAFDSFYNSGAGTYNNYFSIHADGVLMSSSMNSTAAAAYRSPISTKTLFRKNTGLCKIDGRYATTAGQSITSSVSRTLTVKAKA